MQKNNTSVIEEITLKKRAVRVCGHAKENKDIQQLLKQLVCGEITKRQFVELGEKILEENK